MRYRLSTGRIPNGTGRIGPRSESVGPSIGGSAARPAGPIYRKRFQNVTHLQIYDCPEEVGSLATI